MATELGLKMSNVLKDFSSAGLLSAEGDRSNPLFNSTESDTMFILTARIRGYRRGNIKIEINKDGSQVIIVVEKPVQEMVVVGNAVVKKVMGTRGFIKAFKIPNGVNPDKITASFKEEESLLTISMPKLVKGRLYGVMVEEVKEEEEVGLGTSSSKSLQVEEYRSEPERDDDKAADQKLDDDLALEKVPQKLGEEKEEETKVIEGQQRETQSVEKIGGGDEIPDQVDEQPISQPHEAGPVDKRRRRRKPCCVSLMAGSAFLVSVIVFVIHWSARTKQPTKKRETSEPK